MKHVALATLLLGTLGGVAQAQVPPASSDQRPPVFRSAANLVALNVSVSDGRHYITGLEREDFAVFEDGVQQRIEFFETRDIPLDLILLLDTSSSMRGRMNVVQAAASGFMQTLRPGDRGAIVTFGDTVAVAQTLTSDREALEAAIRGTRGYGGTALHNALYIALKQFGRRAHGPGDPRRQAFAVLSDGEDTSSLLTFADVLAEARRAGVAIYTIHLRSDYEPATARMARQVSDSEHAMRSLARETGGEAFIAKHTDELSRIYSGIAEDLSAQYSLGYAPTNSTSDGRLRRILVRVISRPELRTRARTSYLAEGTPSAIRTR